MALAGWVSYKYLLGNHAGETLMLSASAVLGNEKVVAKRTRAQRGAICFIPPPSIRPSDTTIATYYSTIAELPPPQIRGGRELPGWSFDYRTEAEISTRQLIKQQEEVIGQAKAKISAFEKQVEGAQADKQLFAATGEDFVNAAKCGLIELGFKVVEGPPRRADLIATLGKELFAIEAKGLDGPAREVNFRQAQQWKTEVEATITADEAALKANQDYRVYAERLGELGVSIRKDELEKDCRSLLVIGTFRKTPLPERTNPSFPDSLAKVITRHSAVAISGLTLLDLVLQVRAKPTLKESIQQKFLKAGVIDGRDWNEFLSIKNS